MVLQLMDSVAEKHRFVYECTQITNTNYPPRLLAQIAHTDHPHWVVSIRSPDRQYKAPTDNTKPPKDYTKPGQTIQSPRVTIETFNLLDKNTNIEQIPKMFNKSSK